MVTASWHRVEPGGAVQSGDGIVDAAADHLVLHLIRDGLQPNVPLSAVSRDPVQKMLDALKTLTQTTGQSPVN